MRYLTVIFGAGLLVIGTMMGAIAWSERDHLSAAALWVVSLAWLALIAWVVRPD